MTGPQPPLHAVSGTGRVDPVVRRRRFEAEHPETVILPPAAGRWRAVLASDRISADGTRTTLGSWDLAGLMDQLDDLFGSPEGAS